MTDDGIEVTIGGQPVGRWSSPRSERLVVLPEWVVRYLAENAFGQYTVAEAVLGGAHGTEEMEAAGLVLAALLSPSRTGVLVAYSQTVELEEWTGPPFERDDRVRVVEVPT